MDYIKESFRRVKEDINFLKKEINFLKNNLSEIKEMIQKKHFSKNLLAITSTHKQLISTDNTIPSTHNLGLEALKAQNLSISTGNQGASTDRQTDRQTNQHTQNPLKTNENTFENAAEILDSLDEMKKELRLKFKRLTNQEMLIFSTLYQLEQEKGYSNYQTIAKKLNLTESSIRDYIGRLIKKGIPLDKIKINNKNIRLSISNNLKKIASLSTILQLRDL